MILPISCYRLGKASIVAEIDVVAASVLCIVTPVGWIVSFTVGVTTAVNAAAPATRRRIFFFI